MTPDPKDDEDDKKRFALLNEKKKVSVRPKPEKKIANIEPFAVGLPKGKKNTNYYSVFIVKAKSDVSKLVDVKGKKVIVGNKHSTSGYIIPKRELNNIGINIDNSLDFLELIRTENQQVRLSPAQNLTDFREQLQI